MKILVVDDQAEAVGTLAQGLREATGHEVVEAVGGPRALELAEQGEPPDVLVTEVVLEEVDGFRLNESLRAARPELRTIYVTGYDLSQYADYINGTPVFYKPADPREVAAALVPATPVLAAVPAAPDAADDAPPAAKSASLTDELPADQRSQSSRLRNLVGKQGFTGRLDQFQLLDIIQMCCVSRRTGRLLIARRDERGVLYLRTGQIIQAVSGELEGEEAAYEIIGWSAGQFSFEDGVAPETQTIMGGWEHLVMEGVRRRDERLHAEGTAAAAADTTDPELAGKRIGPYELRRKIGRGERTEVFEAVQTSMGRTVALKILLPEFQADPAAVQDFLDGASAKANVQYPSILSVYEAGQSEGIYYYTREFVDGSNLAYLRAQGRKMDEGTALQCIRVAAEAVNFLNLQKIPHPPLTPDDVYLGRDGRVRLNNLASLPGEAAAPTQVDIRTLSTMVNACLPSAQSTNTPGLRALLGRMLLDGASGFQSWAALLQAVKALEPKVVPEDAFKLSAQEAAGIAAVNEAKRRQKRALVWTTVGMFALLWLVAVVVYWKFFRVPPARVFDKMVAVPAGEFLYGPEKTKANTGAFWIDEYEVTIGQYAQFLAALKAEGSDKYEAPNVPKGHRHENDLWLNIYKAASQGVKYNGSEIDLNCPAVYVDWFDAVAYAKWKGHRLPTEQEWEKAARGTDGRRFPWGEDATAIKQVNTSADHVESDHKVKGASDGYNFWSPVDVMLGDKSPYGAMDMAGNVAEWTATVERRGQLDYPIVRGGTFSSKSFEVTNRVAELNSLDYKDRVGFRTVSDSAPPAK